MYGNILGRLFSIMRRVLRLSMWEDNSPNYIFWYDFVIIINQRTHVRITNTQSHHPWPNVRFQLSRVGDCSSKIVLCDSCRRLRRSCVLVKTSVFTLDGGQVTEPEPKEQFSL